MLHDLTGRGALAITADVVVIGAGTAGLPLATEMAERGLRVVCLESGGERQREETHPLNAVEQLASPYEGASEGRFRCLGGTSTRWGGALIPFQQADLEGAGWPISRRELDPFLPQVEALFGLEPGSYGDPHFPFALGDTHIERLAKWPRFAARNVAALYADRARHAQALDLYLNAHVVRIATAGPGEPVTVEAGSTGGDRLTVTAPRLVVAAGAIETTRLTLLLDRESGGRIAAASPALGRYFSDHLSVAVAEIASPNRAALNRILGFRMGAGGAMRNIRFELAPDAAERATLPPGFVHVGFDSERPGGFDALREILRRVQQRRLPAPAALVRLAANAPWLARAAWWRFAEGRLLFPGDSRLVVHVVTEQEPVAENRIALSQTRTDPFGLPLAAIDWRVTDRDVAHVNGLADAFERTWNTTGFAQLGALRRYGVDEIGDAARHSGGIYHPTGSTRMGASPGDGVVDAQLRLFALPQVQLLATSVLPTGGGANPTMMLMLLAMRCLAGHAGHTGDRA